jgi:hypothetical protein
MLAFEALGWPVSFAAAVGAAWLIAVRPLKALFLLLFPLAFLAFIVNTIPASRYLNPVLPFAAMLAAWTIVRLSERLPARGRVPALALAGVLAALPGLRVSAQGDWLFRQADTRTLAREFIESRLPAGSTILVQPYSVPLNQSKASLREALEYHLGDSAKASTKFAIRLALPEQAPAYRTIYLGDGGLDVDKIYVRYGQLGPGLGLGALQRIGVQYVVLKRYNTREPATEPLRDALKREGRLLATFSPYRSSAAERAGSVAPFLHNTDARVDAALARPGPIVEVWQTG